MKRRKIILDCDPGHDDAVAITIAGISPFIELLGITVVSGNQTLEKTVKNALNIVQKLSLNVPVYPGCDQPMIRDKIIAADIHGESGLDGPTFEKLILKAEKKHAVNYMIETLINSEEKITIVTTGPMTNLAMAMRLKPTILDKIEGIVLMGGAYTIGNVTPAAEFNILADGDAANVCFKSGLPITMVGLDVTRKVLCYPEIIERMGQINNVASKLFVDLMAHFNKTQKQVFGWDGGPLHDPLTIAYIIDPTVLITKPMYATVDIRSIESYGRTNCDYFNYFKKSPTVNVAIDVNVEKFWDLIEESLKLYSDR